jgi:hypothetical protein
MHERNFKKRYGEGELEADSDSEMGNSGLSSGTIVG